MYWMGESVLSSRIIEEYLFWNVIVLITVKFF